MPRNEANIMRKRHAFTLVELLVATALTIFVMTILTQAFVVAIDVFTGLKGIGDMQENLRSAASMLRYDLQQQHLEGTRRLSDPTLGLAPGALIALPSTPPTQGFLRVTPALTWTSEGLDGDNMPSARAIDQVLHMMVRQRSNQPQNYYTTSIPDPVNPNNPIVQFFNLQTFYGLDPLNTATYGADADWTQRRNYSNYPNPAPGFNIPAGVPPNTNAPFNPVGPQTLPTGPYFYKSQAAEVAYFLGSQLAGPFQPTGTTEAPLDPTDPAPIKLYSLYRAQFATVQDSTALNNPANAFPGWFAVGGNYVPNPNYMGFACNLGIPPPPGAIPPITFLTPADLASPAGRTLNLTNVATFSQRAFSSTTLVLPNVISFEVRVIRNQTTAPFQVALGAAMNYDSSNGGAILGLAITLRVWDNKTRQTRQMTIMQDL
jgi:type II secretory pathway pseudopilin PulG